MTAGDKVKTYFRRRRSSRLAPPSAAKASVVGEFLGMLRSAAIDCTPSGTGASCYAPPKSMPFEPDIRKDAARRVAQVVKKGRKKYVVLDGDVSTLYDYDAYKERGETLKVEAA